MSRVVFVFRLRGVPCRKRKFAGDESGSINEKNKEGTGSVLNVYLRLLFVSCRRFRWRDSRVLRGELCD